MDTNVGTTANSTSATLFLCYVTNEGMNTLQFYILDNAMQMDHTVLKLLKHTREVVYVGIQKPRGAQIRGFYCTSLIMVYSTGS